MFDVISQSLGIEDHTTESELPISYKEPSLPQIQSNTSAEEKATEDFDFAREKIRDAIEKASEAMEDMVDLARASDHPRAFEVLSGMAANVTSMADTLVKMHKETLKAQQKPESSNVTNQNLILTTDALIKLLKNNS